MFGEGKRKEGRKGVEGRKEGSWMEGGKQIRKEMEGGREGRKETKESQTLDRGSWTLFCKPPGRTFEEDVNGDFGVQKPVLN